MLTKKVCRIIKTQILHQSTLSTLNMSPTSISNILKPRQLPEDYELSDADILCGRGRACLKHPGNKTFSEVVRANLQRYIDAPKRVDKSIVVASVADSLKESGGRFIKRDKHSKLYCELSDDQAHEKIGHAIRDLVKKNDTRSAGRKMAKKPLPLYAECSRKGRSKVVARILQRSFSKIGSQELSSQADMTPSEILSAAFELSGAFFSIDDDYFAPDQVVSENFGLLNNEQEQGDCVTSSPVLAPLPLSSETRIECADIRRVFEILSEDRSGPLSK
jgi:hypothetical protein